MNVLLVGDTAHTRKVGRLLETVGVVGPVHTVPDYLMALGHMAADPPTVLISRVEDLDDPPEPAAEALRSLAPGSRLLLTTSSEHRLQAVRAVDAGFDDYLIEPIDSAALGRVLAGAFGSAEPGVDQGGARGASASVGSVVEVSVGVAGGAVSVEDEADLIEQVMCAGGVGGAGGVVGEAVLRCVSKRSGLGTVEWSARREDVPADHVCALLRHGDQELGFLHAASSSVTQAQLHPWAGWVAKWLGLERHVHELSQLAMRDELTGLWNRRYFNRFLNTILGRAADRRFYVSLLVFDIDDFKRYNDEYGHLAGDDILRESARLMQSLVREHDVVARIGGDEFAVIFWDPAGPRQPNSSHPHDPVKVAERFRVAVSTHRFPKLGHEAPGTLRISGGLASFPWDGRSAEELLDRADRMALQSKQQGKDAITFGPGVRRNSSCGDL